jgi:hydroxyacylglutathione hydrolase
MGAEAGGLAFAFVGDTLFGFGCGRLFEGTPAQMWASLCRLRALAPATAVYTAHEYTLGNARFAATIDPDHAPFVAARAEAEALRAAGRPTIPRLLATEQAANPFLRADDPALAARLGLAGEAPATVFARLRGMKDRFTG